MNQQTKRGREAQAHILVAIHEFTETHGYAPSYRELAALVKIAQSGVHYHVELLTRAGLVHEAPKIARALRLTDAGRALIGGTPGT